MALLATPLALGVIACGAGSAGKSASSHHGGQDAGGDGATAVPTESAKPTASAKPAKPAKPKTVMTAHGSGIKKTAKFTTGDDWTIGWSYDCSHVFGREGNFIVTIYTDGDLDDIAVNELGKKGSDRSPEYDDSGAHYLEVDSECSWTVKVTVA